MEADAREQLAAAMLEWDRGAWCLAALALTLRPDADPAWRASAGELLVALGLTDRADAPLAGLGTSTAAQTASQAAAPLLQIATLLGDGAPAWTAQSDAALLAQGTASAQAAQAVARHVLPMLDGLAVRLAAPGARMLDVGTGVGSLAVAFAEVFPQLSVTGIDVMDRVLALAAGTVAGSSVADRVLLRRQSVADLDENDVYDLVWLPAPAASGADGRNCSGRPSHARQRMGVAGPRQVLRRTGQ